MDIYISNLGRKVTDESLEATFATYGKVSFTQVLLNKYTGLSNGCAFIEMPNETEATTAILKMQGCILDGRAIDITQKSFKKDKHV